jgi:uncharacterized protein YacL
VLKISKQASRVAFIIVGASVGFLTAMALGYSLIIGGLAGGLGALIVVLLELVLRRVHLKEVILGGVGLIAGLIVANLISFSASSIIPDKSQTIYRLAYILLNLGTAYLGVTVTLSRKNDFKWIWGGTSAEESEEGGQENFKILDTSVIIDGRIADICETGFIEGTLVIPRFVLRELQHIADSSDPLKRGRGRRGLDILNKIQKKIKVGVHIHDKDFPEVREVDAKLIKLAKHLKGKVLTNDFNLNKVAELQGVEVLNINELANAVKPVVLPGEDMNVQVIKDGKEFGQGVAYLDDGTMVVVDNGREHMGQRIDVLVTSVLQTTAGRMIFARPKEDNNRGGHRGSDVESSNTRGRWTQER